MSENPQQQKHQASTPGYGYGDDSDFLTRLRTGETIGSRNSPQKPRRPNLMANENPQQQYKHQPSTLGYGDIVLYNQNGKVCNAQVIQSQIVQVPDRNVPGGLRHEEHLTLIYLIPAAGKQVMSQIDMEAAIGRAFGVQEFSEDNKFGWMRATVQPADDAIVGNESTAEQHEFAQQQHSG